MSHIAHSATRGTDMSIRGYVTFIQTKFSNRQIQTMDLRGEDSRIGVNFEPNILYM